mmetsp:Transcript_43390/g.91143  ORF Transcript_43390/g.91143 Transcript_43390/m.91143 type:complete len:84 (-) Transcript_43390:764-1015(-)
MMTMFRVFPMIVLLSSFADEEGWFEESHFWKIRASHYILVVTILSDSSNTNTYSRTLDECLEEVSVGTFNSSPHQRISYCIVP